MIICIGSADIPPSRRFDRSAWAPRDQILQQKSDWPVVSDYAVRVRQGSATAGIGSTPDPLPWAAAADAGGDGRFERMLHRMSSSLARQIGQQTPRIGAGAPPEARTIDVPLGARLVETEVDAPVRSSRRCVRIGEDGRIASATAEAAEWIGIAEDALVGLDAGKAMSLPAAVADAVSFSLTTGRSAAVQTPAPRRPGRWMEYHAEPLGDAVKLRFWDITDAKLRDLRRQSDAQAGRGDLRLADAGSTELALLDENGVIVAANEAWRSAFAHRAVGGHAAGVGAAYLDVCRQVVVNLDEALLTEGLKAMAAGDSAGLTKAYRIRTAAGLRWREVRITPMRFAGEPHLLAIHTDLTEVARAQAALRKSEERVIRAQQEERQRIAIELHDSTGQHLIALGLCVTRLRRLVGTPGALAVLEDMAVSIKEVVREVRVLSYLMKPTRIDDEGLEAAARGFATGFGARTGLNVSFRAEGRVDRVSPAIRHAAFRIIQEALANVHRHAGARGVEVELSCRRGVFSVRVADDGHGIPALRSGKLAPSEIGVGVASMQERVAKLGGSFDIASDDGGAVVVASFPLSTS